MQTMGQRRHCLHIAFGGGHVEQIPRRCFLDHLHREAHRSLRCLYRPFAERHRLYGIASEVALGEQQVCPRAVLADSRRLVGRSHPFVRVFGTDTSIDQRPRSARLFAPALFFENTQAILRPLSRCLPPHFRLRNQSSITANAGRRPGKPFLTNEEASTMLSLVTLKTCK